jgi:hypothetical protein
VSEHVKRKALLFLLFALIATILIGSGLPRLNLQPGMPVPSFENNQVVAPPTEAVQLIHIQIGDLFKVVFAIILVGFLIYLVYFVIKGVPWKELFSNLGKFGLIVLAVFGILFMAISLLPKTQAEAAPAVLPTPAPILHAPLGPVPPFLLWIVGVALAIAAVVLGVSLFRMKSGNLQTSLLEIEVENARQAILTGLDLKDVILQCYQRMSLALQQEQQIERETFMTTSEFELLLEARGVPHEPIHQLTRLFEAVRYGRWQPNPADEHKALQALEAILRYSREKGQAD